MSITRASIQEAEEVWKIVHETILSVYPHYYPEGAVTFFEAHHSLEHIRESIEKGRVYILRIEEKLVGTVTLDENEINRLFVLPAYQGKGYGKALMQFAEAVIWDTYDQIRLSASLSAKQLYIKNGYKEIGYYQIATEKGDYLCYDYMEKVRS